MAGLFEGFSCCRFVTPSLVFFILGYFGPMALISQYIYTRVLSAELSAANITLNTTTDRLIPCESNTSTPQYQVQMTAQSKSSLILMGNTLFSSVPGMLMVLFWGPLSDKWGRKPVLLIAYVGAIAQTIIDFLAIVYKWSPYMLYIGNGIQGFSGGTMGIFCAASAYVADVTTAKTRALRLYIMEGSFFIAMGITFMSVGIWAKKTKSFAQPFLGSFAYLFLGFIYTAFIMAESKTDQKCVEEEESSSGKEAPGEVEKEKNGIGGKNITIDEIVNGSFKNEGNVNLSINGSAKKDGIVFGSIYEVDNEEENNAENNAEEDAEIVATSPSSCCAWLAAPFLQTIGAFRMEGERRWNFRLVLPILVFGISFAANVGGRSAQSLFEENAPFCWDTNWLAELATIKLIAGTLISVTILVIIRKLNLNIGDYPLVAVCIGLSIAAHIIYAFAFKDWHLYVGMAVGLLSLRFPLLRAGVSKECSKDKIGAVFAGVSFVETAANLVGSMGFGPIYAKTVFFFPGFSFLIMALLEVIAICILFPLMIRRLWKKEVYQEF